MSEDKKFASPVTRNISLKNLYLDDFICLVHKIVSLFRHVDYDTIGEII